MVASFRLIFKGIIAVLAIFSNLKLNKGKTLLRV